MSMLTKAKKKMLRVGTEPVKVLFTVVVDYVQLKDVTSVESGTMLSVCFERGGKISATKDKEFVYQYNHGPKTFVVNETLSLIATLYKEKSGRYQEKSGKIIFRKVKKSRVGSGGYYGLGQRILPLHVLAVDAAISSPAEIETGG
jgi:hypothetical protein